MDSLRVLKPHNARLRILFLNGFKISDIDQLFALIFRFGGIGEKCQTGDDLVEKSHNCVVLETTRRFKGLESKVVILYNPPFQDDPSICTKELLYTAVSRCSCFLVVISTKEGCMALKSDGGVN